MDTDKTKSWAGGATLIVAGSLVAYHEHYRNSEFIDGLSYLAVLLGWVILFNVITEGSLVSAPKIPFSEDRANSLKQIFTKLFAYLLLGAILIGNITYTWKLANDRKQNILENGPTQTTTAVIDYIEAERSRSGTHYDAVFEYTVANKTVLYHWHEHNRDDFISGEKLIIQYSVAYPQMFKIVGRIR